MMEMRAEDGTQDSCAPPGFLLSSHLCAPVPAWKLGQRDPELCKCNWKADLSFLMEVSFQCLHEGGMAAQ